MQMQNVLMVPEYPTGSNPTSTDVRWIDNYMNITMLNCRIGGENSGLPIIWNYASADTFFNQSGIIIENSWLISRSTTSAPDDNIGVVVLKTAVPHVIRIVGGFFHVEGYIINDKIPGGVAAWIAAVTTPNELAPIMNIVIGQIPTYPNTPAVIVNDAAALIALTPYLRYDVTTYTGVYNQIPGLQIGYRSGAGDPTGSVVPNFIGEEYLNTTDNH